MSLPEAVLAVAESMEKDAEGNSLPVQVVWQTMSDYAKQLRLIVKASQGNFSPQSIVLPSQVMNDRVKQIRLRDERIKAEEEEALKVMTLLVGGKSDGVMISVPPKVSLGTKTLQNGEVYIMEANARFHFSQEETDKIKWSTK